MSAKTDMGDLPTRPGGIPDIRNGYFLMAHSLSMSNGKAEMAYIGNVPWHGLGQELQPGAPIEDWQISAGMAWKIQKAKVRYATGHGQDASEYSTVDGKVVLLRSDTTASLSIVSDSYKIVQPREVLEFFRDLCDAQGFQLETAGTLFGGTRFWAMASIGDSSIIADPRDKIKGNLLLSTSCDGTLATTGRFVATRVVCNNTLGMALRENGATVVKAKHKSVFCADTMKSDLGIGAPRESFDAFIDQMRNLAATAMNNETMIAATVELFKPGTYAKNDPKELDSAIRSKPVARVLELAIRGNGSMGGTYDGVSGTSYGWLNAVTQYIDHEGRAHSDDNRVDSAWFGKGDALKTQALGMASQVQTVARGTAAALLERPAATMDGGDLMSSLLAKPRLT